MSQVPGKLRWQCRRGMLELDVVLNRFLDLHWQSLDNQLKAELDELLQCSDQQLQKWLCEGMEADNEVTNIVSKIQQTDTHSSS